MKLTARVACKSIDRAQEQQYLAQANGHIAELKVQIVRQRVIVKYALDTGQSSQMVESLLHALEESLRIFERHRELIFAQLQRQPVRANVSSKRHGHATGRDLSSARSDGRRR